MYYSEKACTHAFIRFSTYPTLSLTKTRDVIIPTAYIISIEECEKENVNIKTKITAEHAIYYSPFTVENFTDILC